MINIPETTTKRWVQANSSDLLGNIWYTKNISFDNVGYLSLSNSPRTVYNEELSSDFDNVNGLQRYASEAYIYATTWDKMWVVDYKPLLTLPTLEATAGVPSGDIEGSTCIFSGNLMVIQDTDVDYLNSSFAWVDTNISLTNNGQHDAIHFLSQNALAIADVNTVKLYAAPMSATPTLITTLTIPSEFEITKMEYLNQYLYIGTQHMYHGKAAMFVWNGSGTGASQVYQVSTNYIHSLCAHDNSIYILEANGTISRFNGSGFTQVAAFPLFYFGDKNSSGGGGTVYKGVMCSNGRVIYINFSNRDNPNKRILNQPDGIWCYDENIGLYHKYSNTLSQVLQNRILTSSVNTTTSQITVTSAPVTGTEVFYEANGSTVITGLTDATKYFVIYVDATHIQLATTKANAIAGTEIQLTGTGNNSQLLVFFPNKDWGTFYADRPTFVKPMEYGDKEYTRYGEDVFWSTEVQKRNSSTNWATLQCTSTGVESRGYFVTSKILSNDVTDYWKTFVIKYQPMKSELDKIIVKYRTQDDDLRFIDETYWDITWTSTTTFTTTETQWVNAKAGDEVEILKNAGAGLIAHISTITESSGTYTVTLDDTYDNYVSGDLSMAVFRNWKKLCTITSSETNGYTKLELGNKINGKFIQFKIELRGIGVKIEELSVDDVKFLPK